MMMNQVGVLFESSSSGMIFGMETQVDRDVAELVRIYREHGEDAANARYAEIVKTGKLKRWESFVLVERFQKEISK